MKEVNTRYFCDRCGAEVHPYGKPYDISHGYGLVALIGGYFEPKGYMFSNVEDVDMFPPDATDRKCAMALCGKCFEGLTDYLRNE